MSERERRAAGATAAGGLRRRLWLWIVLAVLVLVALLFALSRCGAGADPGAGGTGATAANPPAAPVTPTAEPTAAAPTAAGPTGAATTAPGAAEPAPAPGSGPAGGAGSLTAGGTALLPVSQAADANGSLAGLVGQEVAAEGVAVESVPADEGFWVGTSATDRIWVQLEGEGESGYAVRQGDRVSFRGQLVANPAGFAQRSGVDAGEGAAQLDRQAAHVTVRQADLRGATR